VPNSGLCSQNVPKKCNFTKYTRGPIYRKIYVVWKETCAQSQGLRSIAHNRSNIPRRSRECDDLGQCGDLGSTWMRSIAAHALNRDALDRGPHARSQARSIVSLYALAHRQGLLASLPPFTALCGKDCNTRKH
jgi:hypothetical protein